MTHDQVPLLFLLSSLLFVPTHYNIDSRIRRLEVVLFFISLVVGDEDILSHYFGDPGGIEDVEHAKFDLVGLCSIVKEIGVGLFPGFADNLTR